MRRWLNCFSAVADFLAHYGDAFGVREFNSGGIVEYYNFNQLRELCIRTSLRRKRGR